MGIFNSASNAICSVFDTITDIGQATEKTVSMATTYVDNRATAQRLTDKQQVMITTHATMLNLQEDLNALNKDEASTKLWTELQSQFK